MGNFLTLFRFFRRFNKVQLTVMFYIQIRRCLDSNCGPLVSDATNLPTEPHHCPRSNLTSSRPTSVEQLKNSTDGPRLSCQTLLTKFYLNPFAALPTDPAFNTFSLYVVVSFSPFSSVTRWWIRKLPNYFKKLHKKSICSFHLNSNAFQNCPKSHMIFGLLL